ncbi:MAG TPA: tetratricopeptide repeat protein [Pyrinomonadaceae bacterium]|nr:tetratricopeptide repeat protein [Pyrinomonadaceae bacterium]
MNARNTVYLLVGIVAGFFIGFVLTNSVSQSGANPARAGQAGPQNSNDKNSSSNVESNTATPSLNDEELRAAIAKGDANPKDASLQRNLGRGLYLYAMNTGMTRVLPDAVRMLKRAYDADPKDYETTVLMGQALFDAGQSGNFAMVSQSRRYFSQALETKPDDVNVRTELGLTYYFDKPSNPRRAVEEYRKALVRAPRHEMTLQSMAAALIALGETSEARQRLDELQSVNPSNATLPNLRAQLARGGDGVKEKN